MLLVTGPVTRNMREALERTYAATPAPKWVIASAPAPRTAACSRGSYAIVGGVGDVVPVDLHIPGCPPSPAVAAQGAAGADEGAEPKSVR